MTTEPETFPYDICGRTILCRHMKDAQRMMMRRMLERFSDVRQENRDEFVAAMVKVDRMTLDVIESLIVQPEDVEFLEQQMLAGKVDLQDLRPILSGGVVALPAPVAADDEPKKAAPRKQPARKAATKKVTKRLAQPGRTKK